MINDSSNSNNEFYERLKPPSSPKSSATAPADGKLPLVQRSISLYDDEKSIVVAATAPTAAATAKVAIKLNYSMSLDLSNQSRNASLCNDDDDDEEEEEFIYSSDVYSCSSLESSSSTSQSSDDYLIVDEQQQQKNESRELNKTKANGIAVVQLLDVNDENKTKNNNEKKEDNEKKPKWRNVTQELAMFRVKRSVSLLEDVESDESVENDAFLVVDDFDDDLRSENLESSIALDLKVSMDKYETDGAVIALLKKNFKLTTTNNRNNNNELVATPKRSFLPRLIRNKKSNKRIKLKTMIKTNDICSALSKERTCLLSRVSINAAAFTKGQCALHMKYNVYKKFELVFNSTRVSTLDTCKYKYSNKSIDKRSNLTADHVKSSKIMNRLLCAQDDTMNDGHGNHRQGDSHVVISHSLDHNRINNELNQTYDQMYLEFLISIQHREITPEDYEYLSRLDELVKKKTVNENILKGLRTEKVTFELLKTIGSGAEEACGVCLENFSLNQELKHLPCGHWFHSECIDSWLLKQSNCCPLDKIAIEGLGPAVQQTQTTISATSVDNGQQSRRQLSFCIEFEETDNEDDDYGHDRYFFTDEEEDEDEEAEDEVMIVNDEIKATMETLLSKLEPLSGDNK